METTPGAGIPYCGLPPSPAALLGAWNLDPVLIAVLMLATLGGHVLLRKAEAGRRRAFLAGMAALAVAFVSPLCALSSALFSARITHHVLLISAAAPLLALAFPSRGRGPAALLPLLVLAHVVTLWVWHAPLPYAAALADDALYWAMELSLLGTGILAWRQLLGQGASPLRGALAQLVLIALMGLLGALITFAPVPLYAPHALVTLPYGLTQLEDQQLAGLLMWAPAMLPNLLAGLLDLRRALLPAPARLSAE